MNDATPRMKALLAGGAVLLVFGITIPANANPDRTPGRPGVGTVGMADENAKPKGQTNDDHNRGFTCDRNQGVGVAGNPALSHDCGGTPPGDSGEPTDRPTGGSGGSTPGDEYVGEPT